MKTARALNTVAAAVLAAGIAATAYSQQASAESMVDCYYNTIPGNYWFNCTSSNGTATTWYVNGVRQSSADGAPAASFSCVYGRKYTISINPGSARAASWSGYCDDLHTV